MGEQLILYTDYQILEARISRLREQSSIMAQIVQQAIEQSSETTHDNAPYDAVRTEKDLIDARLTDLYLVKKSSHIFEPDPNPEIADVGTIVTYTKGDKIHEVEIAGDWHGRHESDPLVVSRKTPFAGNIVGLGVGDKFDIDDDSGWVIEGIRSVVNQPKERSVDTTEEETEQGVEQMHSWLSKRMLYVCGPLAAGKSELVNKAFPEGFIIFNVGEILRAQYQKENPEISFEQWRQESEIAYGSNFTNKLLVEYMRSMLEEFEHPKGIIVVGHRSMAGIKFLSEEMDASSSRIIYINASKSVLHQRYKTKKGRSHITAGEFEASVQEDMKLGLLQVANAAEIKILNMEPSEKAVERMRVFVDAWQDL